MNFNQKELEYLLTCLNFHYDEHRGTTYARSFIDINAKLCAKFSYDLNKIEKAQAKQPDMEW